jgi:hypothetical protein
MLRWITVQIVMLFSFGKWCTRCGSLRLGTEVFHPGKNQKKTIVSVKDMAAKKPTEESVETLEQECKGTTYT